MADVIANFGATSPSQPPPAVEPLAPAAPSPYRPPVARVDDFPEFALGDVQYAGFWVRFAASVLDGLVVLVIAVVPGFVLGFVLAVLRVPVGKGDLWPKLLGFAVSWLYFATLESGEHSATYGKRAFSLQVLTADDLDRVGFLRASIRWIGRFISTFLLIGYLMQPFTPRKRALHDYIAGTVVVVRGYYSQALVVTLILGPIILGLLLGATLKMFEILGR
jgi:uncharacterized RDD family membrane protein YckC